jgi:AbrB family looped-hinge helix DNA binding protein
MPHPDPLTTTVSTKGQVILPKSIRQRRDWDIGTRLIVEDTPDGVLLRQAPAFAATRPEDVFACLPRSAPPVSLDDMDAAILAEARRRHDRD